MNSKMSEIMKHLALTCFRNPKAMPSSEAVAASLLLANVAWNKALGRDVPDYEELLMAFTRSRPRLWSELRSGNTQTLIDTMVKTKQQLYPLDRRAVLLCGMREGNVRVEWCDEENYPDAPALAALRLAAFSKQYGVPVQQTKPAKKSKKI